MQISRRIQLWLCFLVLFGYLICTTNSCTKAPPVPIIEWDKTYGGDNRDYAYQVQQTSDGGYVLVGWTESYGSGSADIYLIKTDSLGDTLWTRTYGGPNSDIGRSVQQLSDGGYIIGGSTDSYGSSRRDVYLLRTDANGDLLWHRAYERYESYDYGSSLDQTSDGGYVIAGMSYHWTNRCDIYVIKALSNGQQHWYRLFSGGRANSVQHTDDGGYIVAGGRGGFLDGTMYLLKLDSNGDSVWAQSYERGDFQSVQQTADGGYIAAGFAYATDTRNEGFCITRTDGNGEQQWMKTYRWSSSDECYCVQQTMDGGYIAVGETPAFHSRNFRKTWIMKTDAFGEIEWTKSYGRYYEEYGRSVQQTADGGYVVTGITHTDFASENVFLVKITFDEW